MEIRQYDYQSGGSMSLWEQVLLGGSETWCDSVNHLQVIEGAVSCNIHKSNSASCVFVECSDSVFKKVKREAGPAFNDAVFISIRFDSVGLYANLVAREGIPDGYLVIPSLNGSENFFKAGDNIYWVKDPSNCLYIKFTPCRNQ